MLIELIPTSVGFGAGVLATAASVSLYKWGKAQLVKLSATLKLVSNAMKAEEARVAAEAKAGVATVEQEVVK